MRHGEFRKVSHDLVTAELDGTFSKARQTCATAAWTGPQTRARIETILCVARISRVLTDSLGQVIGLESLTDEITTAQRRVLVFRDLGCVGHGCTRPPAFCDAHHLVHREHGGSTDLNKHNLGSGRTPVSTATPSPAASPASCRLVST